MTKGARHANDKGMNTPGGEKHLCKGPEAAVSSPCFETGGRPLLLEHWDQGRENSARCGDKPGSRRLSPEISPCLSVGDSLGAGPFPPSVMRPPCPCHWASELTRVPRWADILASGQGCPLRPRHISVETTAHKLFPVLYGDPSPPVQPAQGRPSLAAPPPTIAPIREAALGWAAICTFYEHISVTLSQARLAGENFCLDQLSWFPEHYSRSSHGSPFSKNYRTTKCL